MLNENAVAPPRGGDRWHASSVRNVMLAAGLQWVSASNGKGGAAEPPQLVTELPFPNLRPPDRAERTRIAQKYKFGCGNGAAAQQGR